MGGEKIMSEPKICPGCPTGGRITGVEPIIDPATGGPLKRIINPCSKSRYHPSIKNPERYEYCLQQFGGPKKE
jgi:hypothetical protein